MSLTTLDTPEYGRTGSESALDFAYWMLTFVGNAYGTDSIFPPYESATLDADTIMQPIQFSCLQVSVPIYTQFTPFKESCLEHPITFSAALRKRGSLLFRGNGAVMSLGDTKRVMQVVGSEYVVRHIVEAERVDGYWEPALIPRMVYL